MFFVKEKMSVLTYFHKDWLKLEEKRSIVTILKITKMLRWMHRWEKEDFGMKENNLKMQEDF